MKATKTFSTSLIILFLTFSTLFSATDTIFFDDFETSQGWVRNPFYTDDATTGMWERDNPEETIYDVTMQLGTTVSGQKGLCTGHLAGSYPGSYDIDYGKTTVRSPDITLPSEEDITLSFSYYLAHYSNATSDDYLRVKVVGSTTQIVLEELGSADVDEAVWETFSYNLNDFAGQTIYILIEAADESYASLVEAGVDDVLIEKGTCLAYPPCYRQEMWEHNASETMIWPKAGVTSVGIGKEPAGVADLEVANNILIGDNSTNEWVQFSTNSFEVNTGPDESIRFFNGGLQMRGGGFITTIFPDEIRTNKITSNTGDPLVISGGTQFTGEMKIDGELTAKQVTVTLDGYPDYVFSGNHTMKTLPEIEKYIQKYGTLPGMPSEKEVKKNGIDLGELNFKLVEKIEEMTLLMIALEKKNKALEARIEQIEKSK